MPDNWGDYDRWKTTDPDDRFERICEECGDYLHSWDNSDRCARCDEDREYLERQFDEQPFPEEVEP